jgi:uncharacterized coiled-coil DUF342 family protein
VLTASTHAVNCAGKGVLQIMVEPTDLTPELLRQVRADIAAMHEDFNARIAALASDVHVSIAALSASLSLVRKDSAEALREIGALKLEARATNAKLVNLEFKLDELREPAKT